MLLLAPQTRACSRPAAPAGMSSSWGRQQRQGERPNHRPSRAQGGAAGTGGGTVRGAVLIVPGFLSPWREYDGLAAALRSKGFATGGSVGAPAGPCIPEPAPLALPPSRPPSHPRTPACPAPQRSATCPSPPGCRCCLAAIIASTWTASMPSSVPCTPAMAGWRWWGTRRVAGWHAWCWGRSSTRVSCATRWQAGVLICWWPCEAGSTPTRGAAWAGWGQLAGHQAEHARLQQRCAWQQWQQCCF